MKESPLGVPDHLTFPPFHMGWLNRFKSVEPEGFAAPYRYSRETTQVAGASPI
jgi:hypothetical protein